MALAFNTYLDKVQDSKCKSKDSQVKCLASAKDSKSKPQPDIIRWYDSPSQMPMACSQQAKFDKMQSFNRLWESTDEI